MAANIKYVFSISHPMQYINALEVIHARNLPKEHCAVLFFNKPYDVQIDQLKSIVNPQDWGAVEYIAYPNYWLPPGKGRTLWGIAKVWWSKTFSARNFAHTLRQFMATECHTPLELAATGNYLSRPHRHFLKSAEKDFGAQELMLLDEGTSLPNFMVPIRHNPNDSKTKRFKYRFSRRDVVGRFLRLFGLRFHHPKSVTFFTIYADIQPPQTDKIEANHFARLTLALNDFKTSNEVWFLGTCYVEHNFAHADKYLEIMRTVKAKFNGKTLYYFPHRYESDENLKNIAALGFTIKRPDMAIEPWIIANKKLPTAIAAVATSAIDNISHIFKGKIPVHIFKPAPELFTKADFGKSVADVIDGHVKNGHGAVTVHYVCF